MTPLAIFLLLAAVLMVAGAFVFLVFAPYFIAWFVGRKLRGVASQKDSQGRPIPMSTLGRTGVGNLPLSLGFVAGLGNDAQPEQTASTIVMRPTWGMRMISVVLSAMLIYFCYIGWGELVPATPYTWPVVLIVLAYGVLSTNIYELRYDRDGLVSSGFARQRKEIAWKDLARVTDNGHYLYRLKSFKGETVDVQKYLVGIRDFLTYAQDQMDYHNRR